MNDGMLMARAIIIMKMMMMMMISMMLMTALFHTHKAAADHLLNMKHLNGNTIFETHMYRQLYSTTNNQSFVYGFH